jgi:tetratricopeptide (TPR) repeat protein
MSHSARVLQFPTQERRTSLSLKEAQLAARDFLSMPSGERSNEYRQRFLGSPDIVLAICQILGEKRDSAPALVAAETADIYQWIARATCDLGLFDERDYFLGQTALLAGIASRHLGLREEGFLWLDRAEAGFRHTMNPAPGLANVAYARVALRFEMGRYQDVLELAPSLESSFARLGMHIEAAKCRFLIGVTLKIAGEHRKAEFLLSRLSDLPALQGDPALRARVLAEVGDLQQLEGQFELALASFEKAGSLVSGAELSVVQPTLKMYVGGVYKALGRFTDAVDAFRASQRDFAQLGMRPYVAYLHLVIAESLLEINRDRQAEWEILAALPTIDEVQMVPEGMAAVALLRESVGRQKTDSLALRQVRELLQAQQ